MSKMKSSQETYLILVLAFIGEIRVMNYYIIMIYLLKNNIYSY